MKHEKIVPTTETEWYCDICKGPNGNFRCKCCHKDICYKCSVYDDRDSGDRPDKYCESCWDIGKPYRTKMEDLKIELYNKLNHFEIEWFTKARSGK